MPDCPSRQYPDLRVAAARVARTQTGRDIAAVDLQRPDGTETTDTLLIINELPAACADRAAFWDGQLRQFWDGQLRQLQTWQAQQAPLTGTELPVPGTDGSWVLELTDHAGGRVVLPMPGPVPPPEAS